MVLQKLLIPLVTWSIVKVSTDINDFGLISLDTSQICYLH